MAKKPMEMGGDTVGTEPATELRRERMLRIAAKKDGFRRCGVAFPAAGGDYPASAFTADEIGRLKAEPMLVVHEVD
jgi:hypothetical protein